MTIKEMAEKYAEEQGLRLAYNGSCDTLEQACIFGAMLCLKEFERIIPTLRMDARKLFEERIKELKGE